MPRLLLALAEPSFQGRAASQVAGHLAGAYGQLRPSAQRSAIILCSFVGRLQATKSPSKSLYPRRGNGIVEVRFDIHIQKHDQTNSTLLSVLN